MPRFKDVYGLFSDRKGCSFDRLAGTTSISNKQPVNDGNITYQHRFDSDDSTTNAHQ
jgi:hypothetical protein